MCEERRNVDLLELFFDDIPWDAVERACFKLKFSKEAVETSVDVSYRYGDFSKEVARVITTLSEFAENVYERDTLPRFLATKELGKVYRSVLAAARFQRDGKDWLSRDLSEVAERLTETVPVSVREEGRVLTISLE